MKNNLTRKEINNAEQNKFRPILLLIFILAMSLFLHPSIYAQEQDGYGQGDNYDLEQQLPPPRASSIILPGSQRLSLSGAFPVPSARLLRAIFHPQSSEPTDCTNPNEEGMVYYDQTNNYLRLCSNTGWSPLAGDLWSVTHSTVAPDTFHDVSLFNDSAWQDPVNNQYLRLGLGTTTPQEMLDVDGNVQVGRSSNIKMLVPAIGTAGQFTSGIEFWRDYFVPQLKAKMGYLDNNGAPLLYMYNNTGVGATDPFTDIRGFTINSQGYMMISKGLAASSSTASLLHIKRKGLPFSNPPDGPPLLTLETVDNDAGSAYMSFYHPGLDRWSIGADRDIGGRFVISHFPGLDSPVMTMHGVGSTGFVGIGTTDPQVRLHVSHPADSPGEPKTAGVVRIEGSGLANGIAARLELRDRDSLLNPPYAQYWDIQNRADDSNNFWLRSVVEGVSDQVPLKISSTAPTDSLTINSNGRVGIGTQNPITRMHVTSGLSGATPPTTFGGLYVENNSSNKDKPVFMTASSGAGVSMFVGSTGKVTIGGLPTNESSKLTVNGNMWIKSGGPYLIISGTGSSNIQLSTETGGVNTALLHNLWSLKISLCLPYLLLLEYPLRWDRKRRRIVWY